MARAFGRVYRQPIQIPTHQRIRAETNEASHTVRTARCGTFTRSLRTRFHASSPAVPMIPRIHGLPLLAALLAAAAPAAAQTVQGTLREASGAPVNRVLVALVDAGGHQVARALTDTEGGFSVRAPAAGRYSLRAERIGYTAVTSPPSS